MARPVVVDEAEGTRFPFLRGVLTRSLQDAGVPFDVAYKLASEIRTELDSVSEIAAHDLRARVLRRLEPLGDEFVQRYQSPATPAPIQIRFSDGHETPFSRGRHRQSLVSCGLKHDEATFAAARIYEDLLQRDISEISSRDLRHVTYQHLVTELGGEAARRYLVWQEFLRSDRPLIVVIGGAVGTGKSTVVAEVAHRLDIVRTQSTDMLREVMRVMVPKRLMPALHTSTFKAWETLPGASPRNGEARGALISGYLTQSGFVSVACDAVIRRAVRERVSLILEGVHAHPGLVEDMPDESDAILVRIMLAVLKPRALKSRIRGRGKRTPGRRAKRYLEHFESIWELQSFLLSQADQAGVPIVANEDLDSTAHDVMGILIDELAKRFSGTPDEVF